MSNPIPTHELHIVFPEARGAVARAIRNDKQELSTILEHHRQLNAWSYKICPNMSKLDLLQELALVCFGRLNRQEELEKRIKKNKTILNYFDNKVSNDFSITKAKQYPIVSLIEFNRMGKARCIWHNEKTASMHYYAKTNLVKCFGCNKWGDSIDVAKEIFKLTTGQAVKKLCSL